MTEWYRIIQSYSHLKISLKYKYFDILFFFPILFLFIVKVSDEIKKKETIMNNERKIIISQDLLRSQFLTFTGVYSLFQHSVILISVIFIKKCKKKYLGSQSTTQNADIISTEWYGNKETGKIW